MAVLTDKKPVPFIAKNPSLETRAREPIGAWASWSRFADVSVFAVWLIIVGFTVRHHEKWADEAQAWLIARDLDFHTIWFHELRYEGSPGLWHTMLWIAQHVFHAPYAALGIIGVVCAALGVAFILWKAPFPRPIRYLLVFSYFIVYQYAVIARPYNLMVFLVLVVAYLFHEKEHPERITIPLILLCLLTVHGILLAIGIGLPYLIEAFRSWREISSSARMRYLCCIAATAATLLFLYFVLKPTSDVEEFVLKQNPAKYHIAEPAAFSKFVAIVSGAFADWVIPSMVVLAAALGWAWMRRRFLVLALPSALVIALYVRVHGFAHHHGTLFLAIIAGCWIAWPTEKDRTGFTDFERKVNYAFVAILVCMLAVNVFDAAVCIRNDYYYPYSGAEDAAKYLKSKNATSTRIFGYMYGVAGVETYFDHNIFSNLQTTYYHHGTPLLGRTIDGDQILSENPEYLVIHTLYPELDYRRIDANLNSMDYQLVHISEGYLFFKRSVYEHQTYFIYRRLQP